MSLSATPSIPPDPSITATDRQPAETELSESTRERGRA